jgi:hypothetical protein
MNHEIDVVRRLERLERENKQLRRAGVAALAVTGVALLASATTVCKTVWAERFVLKDSSSRERAVLTAYETGGAPKLSLLDEQGKEALTFGVGNDGVAFLELPGGEGPVRRQILLSSDGPATPAVPATPAGGCDEAKDKKKDDGVAKR